MTEQTFSPGFRFSRLDAIMLVTFGLLAFYLAAELDPWVGAAAGFAVGHFFLFCNVLRMARPLELTWAGAFVGLSIAAGRFALIGWPVVFALSVGLTIVVAAIEMSKPSYHGVGWQSVNPGLVEWWNSQPDINRPA